MFLLDTKETNNWFYGVPVKYTLDETLTRQDAIHISKRFKPDSILKKATFCNCFILSPHSRAIQIFSLFVLSFAFYSTLSAAYFACFGPPSNVVIYYLDLTMEACFVIDMLTNFFMEYEDQISRKTIREFNKTVKHYIKGDFLFDLIAILRYPLSQLFKDSWSEDELHLLYITRTLRLYKILFLLNAQKFSIMLKSIYSRNQSELRSGSYEDEEPKTNKVIKEPNNRIIDQIYIMYIFKVFRILVFVVFLSYYLGTFWYLITKHSTDLSA